MGTRVSSHAGVGDLRQGPPWVSKQLSPGLPDIAQPSPASPSPQKLGGVVAKPSPALACQGSGGWTPWCRDAGPGTRLQLSTSRLWGMRSAGCWLQLCPFLGPRQLGVSMTVPSKQPGT